MNSISTLPCEAKCSLDHVLPLSC